MKKALIVTFILLIILKITISIFITPALGYSDSLAYTEAAKTFFNTFDLEELFTTGKFPPLYSIILSISYLFQDIQSTIISIKIINAILSSLTLFPAYLISKEFLNKKNSFLTALIITFLPPFFAISFYTFSENLFFPLFLTTIYFLLKSFTENNYKWDILAGLFIALSFLTRIPGIIFYPLLIILILIETIKHKKIFYNRITTLSISILAILPWVYIKGTIVGFSLNNILGYGMELAVVQESSLILQKITWTILYSNYTIIALAIIPFLLSIELIRKYKTLSKKKKVIIEITLLASLFTIIIAANNSGAIIPYTAHRVIGRYMCIIFPLFILLSVINMNRKLNTSTTILTTIFLAITTPLILFTNFFPINNSSWAHIGTLKYFLDYISLPSTLTITTLVILASFSFLLIKNYKRKTYLTLILTFFILLSTLNTAIIIYDSKERWEDSSSVQLGYWIKENIDHEASFFIDFQDVKDYNETIEHNINLEPDRHLTTSAYWIRGDIVNIKDIFNQRRSNPYQGYMSDYIITTKEYELELIHQEGEIRVYKTQTKTP